MRDNGPELVEYGAERAGGQRGASVVWTITAEAWKRYVEATRRTVPAPVVAPLIDASGWIEASGHRPTRNRRSA